MGLKSESQAPTIVAALCLASSIAFTSQSALADEYGVIVDAPTLYTGETFEICTKRGVLGACKKTVRRTSENDNDKSGKYQKPQTQKVAQKDLEMRLGADGAVTSDVLTILKQRTEDNRERNLRIV